MVEPSGSLRTIVCMTRYTPEHGLPGHDRICWASAVGGARHLIPLDGVGEGLCSRCRTTDRW
jgi:hypothetical protein